MSLYLCVFDGDEELAGVDVGSYAEFDDFRKVVRNLAWTGTLGAGLPVLLDHPDAEGEWPVADLPALCDELERLHDRPALARFEDTEGRPLASALLGLASLARERGFVISFQ